MNETTPRPSYEQRVRQYLRDAGTVSTKAAIRCTLCPKITAETHSLDKLDKLAVESRVSWTAESEELVADTTWRTKALEWISDYHDQHGHGPTWIEFRLAHDPEAETLRYVHRNRAIASLYRHGYVTGKNIPFGLDVRDEPDRQRWLEIGAKKAANKAAKRAALAEAQALGGMEQRQPSGSEDGPARTH